MDRLRNIVVAHNVTPIKERHHSRNLFNLIPRAHPETLDGAAGRGGHRVRRVGLLRKGGTDSRCSLASHKRRELAAREHSEWRARSSKPHAQRESITNRR
jgi:hypothetical protein